jgi:hypothetical protein
MENAILLKNEKDPPWISERKFLSKWVGRNIRSGDRKAINRIEEAFEPAQESPHIVWKEWTDWQNSRKK